MNNDDFKEVPDNIQDKKEETTNNIDNTNDNKSNDYEDVCYICRRPDIFKAFSIGWQST